MSEEKKGYKELPKGAISPKPSTEYKTGDWGVNAPKIDVSKCVQCNLCHFFCPEGAIKIGEEGYPEVDLDYCKGCGICAKECPAKCIEMVRK